MLNVGLITGAVVVGLVVLVMMIGAMLPQAHVAISSITLKQPPATVWAVLRDFENYSTWWPNVKDVERLPDRNGHEVWSQRDQRNQTMPLEVTVSDPPVRLVTKIATDKLPFGGTWTYELSEAPGGSSVTITESGQIYNPVFRVMARLFFGYHATMDSYLRALGEKLGEDVTPVHAS